MHLKNPEFLIPWQRTVPTFGVCFHFCGTGHDRMPSEFSVCLFQERYFALEAGLWGLCIQNGPGKQVEAGRPYYSNLLSRCGQIALIQCIKPTDIFKGISATLVLWQPPLWFDCQVQVGCAASWLYKSKPSLGSSACKKMNGTRHDFFKIGKEKKQIWIIDRKLVATFPFMWYAGTSHGTFQHGAHVRIHSVQCGNH